MHGFGFSALSDLHLLFYRIFFHCFEEALKKVKNWFHTFFKRKP